MLLTTSLLEGKHLTFLLLAVAAIVVFCFIVRPIFVYLKDEKDLRKFPAPSIAGISNWWMFYVQYQASRSKYVHAVHERLGSAVRIQPNHVSFSDPRAIADIYSFQSGMMKDEFYETFSGHDFRGVNEHSITNTRDRLVHARKRKLLSSSFAHKNITNMDSVIHKVLVSLVAAFDQICEDGPPNYPDAPKAAFINLYKWVNLFTYDAIGEIAFGKTFGFLEMGDDIATCETGDGKQYTTHVIPTFQDSSYYDVLVATWAPLIHKMKKWTWFLQGMKKGAIFTDVVNFKVRERIRNGRPEDYRDFFENFIANHRGEKEDLDYSEILRESNIFIAAGNDTSATAMTNTLFLLLKNPHVLAKLREELDNVPLDESNGIFHYNEAKDLKYLKACLDESLRRRPPVSMGLTREVPKGGATIAGHRVAEGVTVSVPALTVHHDAHIFPDPYAYTPERWAEAEGLHKKAMMDNFIPFSVGPRACIGRNLAYFEQQVLVATLMRRYEFELVSPDYELPVVERLNANPGQFWVKLKRRHDNN